MNTMDILGGSFLHRSAPEVFALSTDSMLLGDFVRLSKDAQVCDLGCGSGVLELLLCSKSKTCQITGLDLQSAACALAAENAARNDLSGRVHIIQGDLRDIRSLLPAGRFTHVVSNPPYFSSLNPAAPSPNRAEARSERCCTLSQLCAAASWLLAYGGLVSLVYRPERLCDLICALRQEHLEPKRLQVVRHHPGAAASLILLEGKYGGKPGLRLEPDLILYEADGRPTDAYLRIYHQKGEV